ncbi:type 1 fimbria pilin [Paraburkholderia sp. BL6665CI2N2]|uniref:fimbrial protein n=1 Tax=Paraburkholderia sp. BL6665CI2N2 TaxID=1938806 RepID=UPI0010658F53|nr:fimbrial protein [Paraburkholderia sp. BL6665CI2N2]TDY20288.1 type 1 fimbria pilin [Paraburkholderia sp. BL6665CI2N2]
MQFGFRGPSTARRASTGQRHAAALVGRALACAVLLSIAHEVRAECYVTSRLSDTYVSFPPTINVSTSAPVGTVVATVTVPVSGAVAGFNYATCSGGGALHWAIVGGPLVANRIGSTTVQGIGYTSYLSRAGLPRNIVMDSYMDVSSVPGGPAAPTFQSQLYLTVNLIKTGDVLPGPLSLNPTGPGMPNWVGYFFDGNRGAIAFAATMPPGASSITTSSCNVTTLAPSVVLPTISTSAFQGVGTTAGVTPFAIGLDCPTPNVRVFITLTDNTASTNTSDMLSLRPDSTAQGIKLQILNANTPISFGPDSADVGNTNQWLAGTSVGGPMNVPLSVRYIQAGSSVRPGTVNGIATFTMSYQ